MGYALAEEAKKLGAEVTLISGPVSLQSDTLSIIRVLSADDMYHAVTKAAPKAHIIIMSAAVSDYKPKTYSPHKMKKKRGPLTLHLVPTVDILKELGKRKKPGQVLVGFAAETDHLLKNASQKMKKKNLDMIIANHVGKKSAGFESDFNQATVLIKDGTQKRLPSMTKKKMAKKILALLQGKLRGQLRG